MPEAQWTPRRRQRKESAPKAVIYTDALHTSFFLSTSAAGQTPQRVPSSVVDGAASEAAPESIIVSITKKAVKHCAPRAACLFKRQRIADGRPLVMPGRPAARPPTWTLLRDLDWMNETPMGCAWLIWTLSEMRACCLVVGLSVTSGACCGIDTCCHVV
ncbi:hypothetical protein MRX96_037929 [Rhipicephalus microplus]